ncbi:MAG: DUF3592 domain-containing protein [Planctomycetales bacterium]|nr:DUF3592 domain-containing protein [Planctomycetales bacterium]
MNHPRIHLTREQMLFVLVFLGLGGLLYECFSVSQLLESARWESTYGSISLTEFVQYEHDNFGQPCDPFDEKYKPVVTYRYYVDGVPYANSRIAFGEMDNIRLDFRFDPTHKLEKYPKGTTVTVFYDPDEPSEAVLERTLSRSGHIAIIASFVILFVGVGGVMSERAKAVHRRPEETDDTGKNDVWDSADSDEAVAAGVK